MPLLLTGACAVVLSLLTVGCPQPGDLENADAYPADPSVGGKASGGGSTGSPACDAAACLAPILSGCNACHGNMIKLGKLDLQSPDLGGRLKDAPSQHDAVANVADCPTGDKLINSANVAESWFLKKLKGEQGACGTVMPSSGMLGATDLQCMTDFVNCVATGSGSASGGQPAGGAATGGAGAASGGGGTGGTGGTGGA